MQICNFIFLIFSHHILSRVKKFFGVDVKATTSLSQVSERVSSERENTFIDEHFHS